MGYIRGYMIQYSALFFITFLTILTGCSEINKPSSQDTLRATVPLKAAKEATTGVIHNTIVWHWENRFEKEEVYKIKQWLGKIDEAVIDTYGKYPFEMHFYMHRSKSGNEPVPWAHTTRGKDQGVHFHVNTSYSLADFLGDWTAQHEISHLSIPFVGKENAWFSEGYATFMQCQVMEVQGVMSSEEVDQKYAMKLANCKKAFQTNLAVPQAADSLKKAWNYPAMYWGGVSFFWKLDAAYQSKLNMSLPQVINAYVSCCRVGDSRPEKLCEALDQITETSIASELLIKYQSLPARLMFEDF